MKRKTRKLPKSKPKRIVAIALAVLVVALVSAGLVLQSSAPKTATVQFFSNNTDGYACFLTFRDPDHGGPFCLSDNPRLKLPSEANVPVGKHRIVFVPFGTASNKTLWYSTNNIQITGSGPYDVSSSYANVTISGDGAIAVFVLPQNTAPVPEFPQAAMALATLVIPLVLLRRRR